MEHRICGTIICTLVLLPATFFCSAHADKMQKSVAAAENEPLSTFLPKRLGELGLVGAGVGMIRSDGSIWANGYGLASMEDKIPATADTVAMWASCSKVVTGAAALKAMESKHIGLDTPVNSWLPFEVVNPGFSDKAITFRMLLTHTSSILLDPEITRGLYVDGDSDMNLGSFLQNYLVPGGRFYRPGNYDSVAPGKKFVYSNINASLLGLLTERITGMPFPEYCRQAIFQPLGMREAGWFLRDLDVSHVAVQYSAPRLLRSRRVEHYGWPGYPDGTFRTSASGMLRIMSAYLGRSRDGGPVVLSPAILAEVFKLQGIDPVQLKGRSPLVNIDSGLVWRLLDLDGRKVWSHNGDGSGMATVILLDDQAKAAAVFWVTGGALENREGQLFFVDMMHRLLAEMIVPGRGSVR